MVAAPLQIQIGAEKPGSVCIKSGEY